ncbi:TlpA disulfide reductase family protein [Ureibacillus acetophenoni]|uniref:Peroxiredoxin n=1 Tax=Ureibacillus acetophenoni TaxID=614649 RepID=A0A285UML7_9BACL|nr:TlpA disulfide reductase family protein [Ureibacillus acetophenoni]SOC43013.1 peroxiredoxin [Ureibacillus acetophenoni]
MLKKYISVIFVALFISYVTFVILSEENIKNLRKTVQVNEQGTLNESLNNKSTEITGYDNDSQKVELAPEFTLSDLNGKAVNLSDFKGKIVILNFWTTWCPPCIEEMPEMQRFYEKNKDHRIEIVAVNLTNFDNGQQAIESFVQDYGLTFPVLLDKDGVLRSMYEILTIPTSFILDTEGGVFQKIVGPMNEQMMDEIVNSIQRTDEKYGE